MKCGNLSKTLNINKNMELTKLQTETFTVRLNSINYKCHIPNCIMYRHM